MFSVSLEYFYRKDVEKRRIKKPLLKNNKKIEQVPHDPNLLLSFERTKLQRMDFIKSKC